MHEEVHFDGLSVTIKLMTQLVRVMGVDNVLRCV